MAVKAYWYSNFFFNVIGLVKPYAGWKASGGDSFKVMLTTSAYIPSQGNHKFKSDVTNEVSGVGYTAGGIVLSNKTLTINSFNKLVMTASPIVWSSSTFTCRYAIIYDDTNAASADKQLVFFLDFGQDIILNSQTLTVAFDGAGNVIIGVTGGDTTPPELQVSAGTPSVDTSKLTLDYNEPLDVASVPATSSYAVLVNGSSRSVTTVLVVGSSVVLTLSSPVISTDIVTVAYTVPGSNPIKDLVGNAAISFTAQSVLNITTAAPGGDVTPPSLLSATVNLTNLTLTYNEALLNTSVPATGDFVVVVAAVSRAVTNVSVTDMRVILTLASPASVGQVVTISYTAGANKIKDLAGNNAANLAAQSVTNNTTADTLPPQLVSATLDTSTLSLLYNELLLSTSTPATTAFACTVNGSARGISGVVVASKTVTLTLSSAVISTDVVVLAYTVPASNQIKDTSGNQASSFTNQSVQNTTAPAPAPIDNAGFVSQMVSVNVQTGTSQTVTVVMSNTGTTSWSSADGYHLYSQNPAGNAIWGISQVPVPAPVLPGSNCTFSFLITSPLVAGTYNFQWRMRHTTTEFGSQTTNQSIVVSSPPPISSGRIFFVSTTGNDSNAGSQTAPFRTLAKGVSVLLPDDILYMRSGTFTESLMDNIPSGTSWSHPVTVACFTGEVVTITPPAGSGWVAHFLNQKYIILDGGQRDKLVMDAINCAYDVVKITYSSTAATAAHHIRIRYADMKNSKSQGVIMNAGVGTDNATNGYNEILYCTIRDNRDLTTNQNHSVYCQCSFNLMEGIICYNYAGQAIHIFNNYTSGLANSNIVRKCIVHDVGLVNGNSAYIISSGNNNLVYDCIAYNCGSGFADNYAVDGTKFYNNLAYNCSGGGFRIGEGSGGGSGNCTIRNSIAYLCNPNLLTGNITGFIQDHNLFGTNPLFANAAIADFHLQFGSPAINAGATLIEVPDDFDGVKRPVGAAYDIGPYER